MKTRNELRAEWNELDIERRTCKDAVRKSVVVREMTAIEKKMKNAGDIESAYRTANASRSVSSLSSGGNYMGMGSRGMCMGDGNYWVSARR